MVIIQGDGQVMNCKYILHDRTPPSVSIYHKLRSKPVGYGFRRPNNRGEVIALKQWIQDGSIEVHNTKYIVCRPIKPKTKYQRIHEYVITHQPKTAKEISAELGIGVHLVHSYFRLTKKKYIGEKK
jgi:hypothetical protein